MEEKLIEELKSKYLKKVVQPSLPFIGYFGGTSWRSQGQLNDQLSFHSPRLCNIESSDFYFLESNMFIHYTTLRNAVSIINDGYFRLNSLAYLDDPQELLYAGNEILGNYEQEELEALKNQIFCISLCEYSTEKKDNFDSWRLYGDNGLGVGIVFHFGSNTKAWLDNYLSKIHYGKNEVNTSSEEETTEKFKLLKTNHDEFITENEGKVDLLSSIFGRKGKIPEWIAIFLAFHKSSLYIPENEIRFLRYGNKFGNYSFSLNQLNERTYFDKLFIKTRTNLNWIKEETKAYALDVQHDIYDSDWIRKVTASCPIVEIDKLIIGYRRLNDFRKLKKALHAGFSEKNGQSIEVELSPLSKAFRSAL